MCWNDTFNGSGDDYGGEIEKGNDNKNDNNNDRDSEMKNRDNKDDNTISKNLVYRQNAHMNIAAISKG